MKRVSVKIILTISLSILFSCKSIMPKSGLLLYFPIDENTPKLTERSFKLAGPRLTEDRFGRQNEALLFDGIDDYVEWENDSSTISLPMSFSFWVNFNELKSSILGNDTRNYYQSGIWFSVGQSTETRNKIAINIGNGETPPGPLSRRTFIANQQIETKKWYHVVGIVENINSMKIFINNLQCTGDYTGSAKVFSHTMNNGTIGRVWDPNTFFAGKVDDFRIYQRTITPEEIAWLYHEK